MSHFPYVQIAVSLPLDGLYTYSVPKGMSLEIGHAVLVPFGKQKVSGYVIEFLEETHLTTVRSISHEYWIQLRHLIVRASHFSNG